MISIKHVSVDHEVSDEDVVIDDEVTVKYFVLDDEVVVISEIYFLVLDVLMNTKSVEKICIQYVIYENNILIRL